MGKHYIVVIPGTRIKFCPQCHSEDVHIVKANPLHAQLGMPAQYSCHNCRYTSHAFPDYERKKALPKNSHAHRYMAQEKNS